GNPNLTPEVSKSWTAGFTFTPSIVPNLSGSIDYFHLKLSNEIGVSSIEGSIQGCLQQGDAPDCSQIVRNNANFGLNGITKASGGYIIQTDINVGEALFSGVDVQTN